MNVCEEELGALGLSASESKIYIFLLGHGPSMAGAVSKGTEFNRTTTYQVLDRLIAAGLASYMMEGGTRIYQAAEPERLLTIQDEKQKLAASLIPRLRERKAQSVQESVIFRGRAGIKTILQEILKMQEYASFGSAGSFFETMEHDFLLFQSEKRKRRIKSRVIIAESFRKSDTVKEAYARFRYVSDALLSPTTTWVYGDTVVIVLWPQTPVATVLRSPEAAQAFRAYFEMLWEHAKP